MIILKNKSKKEIVLSNCILALAGSAIIDIIYPPFAIITFVMKLASIGGMTFVVATYSKYDKIFWNCGLNIDQAVPLLKYTTDTDYSTLYHFTLPAGLSLQDFEKSQEAIENYLGKQIKISYTFKEIVIEEFNHDMKTMYEYEPIQLKGFVPIIIGYDRRGELISCDLGTGEPHMMIAGVTGGGKSTAIRCMLTNLILYSDVKLHLIDLKNGVELRLFADSNKVLSFSRTVSQAGNILHQLDILVDDRYNLFYANKVKDIVEYNKKFPNKKMDYQLLVVDEFADLQSEKDLLKVLESLSRKARSAGIHLLLATQRPDAKIITGAIKANIPTVLGLKTTNNINSRIIIDETGLENLRGNGHGLFRRNGDITEVQCPFVTPDKVAELIKDTYIDKRPKISKTKFLGSNKEIIEAEYVEVEDL